jgi:competence protein ComEC
MATTDLPGPAADRAHARLAALRSRLAQLSALFHQWSNAESGRLALWTPVAIGAGAVLYFSLKTEPPAWVGPAWILASVTAWASLARFRRSIVAAFLVALGFAAADWRAVLVDAPVIARETPVLEVSGRLVSVEESPSSRRLIVAPNSIEGVDADALPRRARISWRGKEFDALPGDAVTLRASLKPPPAPEVPGGFDFARQLYFEGIGAVGYAVTPPVKLSSEEHSLAESASAFIERARLAITRRILEATNGSQGGAMVAASVTGHRGAINAETEAALRNSGLAHLVAISGLNMALATGLIFFSLRGALAMIEPVALRYPNLLLSGGEWSALRAFIMTAIVFVAIIFDRRAISLRNVAIAATLILLATPEAVMHPGFQMSFAAVTALVAAYEWSAKRADPHRSFAPLARVRRYVVGIAATDVIAAGATAPFSIYHFNQAANYGLPANVVAIPIMAFAVMPMAVIALMLMPFGLDGWAWRAAAAGVDAILVVGSAISSLPGAVIAIAQWPQAALGVLTLGGLWLCLQTARWRLGGLAAVPVAAVFIALTPAPSLFVSGEGDNAAIMAARAGKPALAMSNARKNKFAATVWKEHAGLDPGEAPTLAMAEVFPCDGAGCVALVRQARIAFSTNPLELAADCRRANLVVALYPVAERAARACAATLIDRRAVWERGAHAAWIEGEKIRIRTVSEARGRRPWTTATEAAPTPRSGDDPSRSPAPAQRSRKDPSRRRRGRWGCRAAAAATSRLSAGRG